MVIAHNLSAMNTQRQFHISIRSERAITEKLSSGYRINRSADDAAGLSISEKMRNQIRGLNQAVKNIEDGVSLIQTADGALNEVHAILHRIGELAVKASNDTNADEDREIINDEVTQLKDEISEIFKKTEFNGKSLFTTSHIMPGWTQTSHPNIDFFATGITSIYKVIDRAYNEVDAHDYYSSTWSVEKDNSGNYLFSHSIIDKETGDTLRTMQDTISKADFQNMLETGGHYNLQLDDINGNADRRNIQLDMRGVQFKPSQPDLKNTNPGQYANELAAYEEQWFHSFANADVQIGSELLYYCGTLENPIMKDMVFQSGANSGEITSVKWKSLNLTVIGLEETHTTTHDASQKAIGEVQRAIKIISGERSNFGAIQNRLEKCINNNQNYAENLQNAESTIRDTDMASEVLKNTKYNILKQVSQAMLAQINQTSQSVLSLLQ